MKLATRFPLAACLFALCVGGISAQEASRANLLQPDFRAKDLGSFTRTIARKTRVVEAIDRVKAAVVNIHSERNVPSATADLHGLAPSQNRVNGMGTGILIDPRGYIVTNHHVVEDVSYLRIRLADGSTHTATIFARSPETDLAIIRIKASKPQPIMPIGTALDLMVGETVLAIGNAYGYEHTASLGIVSAIKRDVSLNKDMQYKSLIQTDAPINPGNSGGPLININGELVGVNVAIRAGAQSIGFAIPADNMIRTVADMMKARRKGLTYDGIVARDQVDTTRDVPVRSVLAEHVDGDSPAAKAGIKPGDFIEQIGDVKILTTIDVERAFLDRKSGESLPVFIRRDEQEQRLELVLAGNDRGTPRIGSAVVDLVWQKLGLQLASVAPDAVNGSNKQLNGGLEVTSVQTESSAAKAGIRKGDILVGLHQWETLTVNDVHYVLTHPELATFSPLSFYILRQGQVRRGYLTAERQ